MKQVAENAIRSEVSFFENVHRALYSILEFRKEHQLMIKLIQEERDMGTKEVQESDATSRCGNRFCHSIVFKDCD